MNATDQELLGRYGRERAEEAFGELVRRHLNLVYSAALRQVRSPQLAEEVAQSAFTDLARGAARLAPDTVLSAWLYQVTRRTAIDVVRREARRQVREQIACEMNALNATPSDWTHIAPLLDEAMQALDETDRTAVLLRYFENKSLREVGQTLGASEDAAQKRVGRALERLRAFFAQRGVTVGTGGLAALLSAQAVQAAPAGLAITLAAAALAALALPAAAGAGASAGFLGSVWHVSRAKLLAGLAAGVLVGVSGFLLFRAPPRAAQPALTDAAPTVAANADQNVPATAVAAQETNGTAGPRQPNPLHLLLAVAEARQRIVSGSLEFQLAVEQFRPERRSTNHLRLTALFAGSKLRSEQFGHEYSYAYAEDEAQQADIRQRADRLDRDAAVRAGLLKRFESHHALIYDGSALMDYWEKDGKPDGTTIVDPSRGTSSFIFDPRCLGLTTVVSMRSAVESCLGYTGAKSIALLGEELVEGLPAWHVRVQSKYGETLDFWIEVAHPEQLLRHARGANVTVSKYDQANARDPIPTEVTTMNLRNGAPSSTARFLRTQARFNLPVAPSSFTLAGLGMQVGTPVTDVRISRRIGYWTGVGLSDNLPRKTGPEPQPAPHLDEMLALLEDYPGAPEALAAATWILLNTPDGPEVAKAAEVIQQEHTRDTNLVSLCEELERMRPRCAKPLLAAILKDNPSTEVRGTACLTLATLYKAESQYGQNKSATAEAEKHFERVVTQFGQVTRPGGAKLAETAQRERSELRRLTIGQPAPEIEGEDLDGRPLKLSDYHGKVVVLTFWWAGYHEAPEHVKLVERMAGKPFAFLGVYGDVELAKGQAEVKKYGLTWPSFRDPPGGAIATTWNVQGWPNLWVLDRQGLIRYRGLRGSDLVQAVEKLLAE